MTIPTLMASLVVVLAAGLGGVVYYLRRIYLRLDRLPPRRVATTIHGDELYRED